MEPNRPPLTPILVPILLAAVPLGVPAASFKCVQPDGSISYQMSPCPSDAEGGEISVDTSAPGGAEAARSAPDYSVEAQVEAFEKLEREQQKAKEAELRRRRAEANKNSTYDEAYCAKYKAYVARWEDRVSDGYRTTNERDYEANMVRYYQAQVKRYCAGR